MWHCLLNRRVQSRKVVRQLRCRELSAHSHHAAADVHPNCCWNDRAARREDRADSLSKPDMHSRHYRNMLENELH